MEHEDPSTGDIDTRFVAERGKTYFDSLVPASRGKNSHSRCFNPFYNLDGRVVLRYLARLARRDIEHSASVICATRQNLVPFLVSCKK